MASKQFVCGTGNGPVNGQTTFTADFLENCFVNFIIVNNVNESQSAVSPEFSHSYIMGCLTRTNPWVTGDNLIIDYTNCKCQNCN